MVGRGQGINTVGVEWMHHYMVHSRARLEALHEMRFVQWLSTELGYCKSVKKNIRFFKLLLIKKE